MMPRKKTPENKALKYLICTRVCDEKYQQLEDILSYPPSRTMSALVRDILENRRIKIFIHDRSIDPALKELAEIREKIRLTGLNINQNTKSFNSNTDLRKKEFYAKLAFGQYITLNDKIERSLEIVTEFAKRWLPGVQAAAADQQYNKAGHLPGFGASKSISLLHRLLCLDQISSIAVSGSLFNQPDKRY